MIPVGDGAKLSTMTAFNSKTGILFERCWYAAYTYSHHEYSVAKHLANRGVEFFLPEYKATRRWKDRTKHLSLPLFPGYVFVRIAPRERMHILAVPSIVRLVGSKGQPIPVRTEEIDAIRQVLNSSAAEPHPFLDKGKKVLIINGPLAGVRGIVLNRKHHHRLILSIPLIQCSVCVELDVGDVQFIQNPTNHTDERVCTSQ